MDRHKAIRNLYENVCTIDDTEGAFDENGNQIILDEAKISVEMERLQAEYDSKQYQRDRAADYPSWQEQMDLLYHGGVDALKAELKKTKDKFPKPE